MPKISGLPPIVTPDGVDELAIVDSSSTATKKMTLTQLVAWVAPNLPDGTVKQASFSAAAGELNADWVSWTPTWTNLSVGNGNVASYYLKIGRTIWVRIFFQMGTTSTITGDVQFTLPVTASANVSISHTMGQVRIRDSGVATYVGHVELVSTTNGSARVHNASGTYLTSSALSGTVPITWANLDTIHMNLVYEAASA